MPGNLIQGGSSSSVAEIFFPWIGGFLAAAVFAGCGVMGGRAVPAPPAGGLEAPTMPLRVALLWKAPVDLDLYVTDPTQETVYFANSPSGTGGKLEEDIQCRDVKEGPHPRAWGESVTWERPRPGRYRVGVDFIDACGHGRGEVGFRVVADTTAGRVEATGMLPPIRFEPIVLEFDVSENEAAESPR